MGIMKFAGVRRLKSSTPMLRGMSVRRSLICRFLSSLLGIGVSAIRHRVERVYFRSYRCRVSLALQGTIAQSSPSKPPTYVPSSTSSSRSSALPSQRGSEDKSIGEDYQLSALQPDYQGNLWIWLVARGLAKIQPQHWQNFLSRVAIPNPLRSDNSSRQSGTNLGPAPMRTLARRSPNR
jgi:hypothetical protein